MLIQSELLNVINVVAQSGINRVLSLGRDETPEYADFISRVKKVGHPALDTKRLACKPELWLGESAWVSVIT